MKIVQPLSLAILVIGVSGFWWGKYPSQEQARLACYDWRRKGEEISYILKRHSYYDFEKGEEIEAKYTDYSEINRKCSHEASTKQYLGRQGKFNASDRAKEGKTFIVLSGGDSPSHPPEASEFKIVKHFRY